jgi:hypothetical protein
MLVNKSRNKNNVEPDNNQRPNNIKRLHDPKEPHMRILHKLLIGPTLDHQSLNPKLVISKVPFESKQLFANKVLGHPKLKDNNNDRNM